MRGLMIGRFQPFHLGHLDLVKQILSDCDEVVIGITGSQFNYIAKDPFTSGERIEMIHQSLIDEQIDLTKCFLTALDNQENNATWGSYLEASLPKFEKIYSGNEYVQMLLSGSNFDVVSPNFLNKEKYNASKIRDMIKNQQNWEQLVPAAVVKFIKKIDGVNRIKTISSTDTKPQEF